MFVSDHGEPEGYYMYGGGDAMEAQRMPPPPPPTAPAQRSVAGSVYSYPAGHQMASSAYHTYNTASLQEVTIILMFTLMIATGLNLILKRYITHQLV